jgi:phosphohistidine phosphatase
MPSRVPALTPSPRSLFLVRHAIAAEHGEDWPNDAERPLTRKGIARMQDVARGLGALGVEIQVVLTSPLLRARQTAELLAAELTPGPAVVVVSALEPGVAPTKVVDAIGAHATATGIALVGHEPGLGELAAWLVGARAPFPLKKGGVCRIDLAGVPPANPGQLIWLATPRMLRGLAT